MIPDKLDRAIRFLNKQSQLYYNQGDSEISDAQFDMLKDKVVAKLKVIDPNHPFLKNIGTPLPENSPWEKKTHEYPLGSLDKVQKAEELNSWYKPKFGQKLVVQEKLDGISICLTYENGKLISAVTRGEGDVGENICRNVLRIPNVPKKIQFLDKLVLRGEIILQHSIFTKYDLPFKNARNATAGIAKRFDGKYSDKLSIKVYTLMNAKDFGDIKTELETIDFLKYQGFDTVNTYYMTLNEIHDLYNSYVNGKRKDLDWDIDGLVIKTNHINFDNFDYSLNEWSKPKNQIAFKFPHEEGESTIVDIEASVGGEIICPVAVIKPIDLCGVTITRASLANWKLAKEQNMGIGSEVLVSRRNDVIPKIEKVLVKGADLVIPKNCPVCGGDTAFDTNEAGEELAYLICTNPDCIAKLSKKISKWLEIHGVKNIGDSIIDTLIEKKFVNSLYSFLMLPYHQDALDILKGMDGYGTRKINIITSGIESTFKSDLKKFISGLNFKNFGRSRTEDLLKASRAETFEDFYDFVKSPKALDVSGFGSETILSLRKQIDKNYNSIKKLLEIVKLDKQQYSTNLILDGMSICITGELSTMSRPKAQELVKDLGGKASSSVSSNTTYLVSNDPTSTSSKMKKARDLNIPIINEQEFLKLIGKDNIVATIPEPKKDVTKKADAPKVQPDLDKPHQPDLFDINDL